MTRALHYKTLSEISRMIRRREISSEVLVAATLDRIAKLEPQLHAFVLVLGETAIAEARRADRELAQGFERGPLHGIPIGIKDLIDVAGFPTASGTEVMRDKIAQHDATVTVRLRQAGAIIIGKLHMTEGATLDHHPAYPRPSNPWGPDYWTGVSSSGSGVSVAAGMCFGALGSDTGGSIRMPSSACGLSGIKPSWGRVSRHGVFPLAESFDHVGPICRSVADAALMLGVIAGRDAADPTSLGAPVGDYAGELGGSISGLRIGLDHSLLQDRVAPEVIASIEHAANIFERLGAKIIQVQLPPLAEALGGIRALLQAETCTAHAGLFPRFADRYGPKLRATLEAGKNVSAIDVARAVHARAAWCGRLQDVLAEIDLLLLPAAPYPTPSWTDIDELDADPGRLMDHVGRYTLPFNASGSPTLSLPCGFTSGGMPLGMQLVGQHLSEALLCKAGHAFQTVTDFHTCHPELD